MYRKMLSFLIQEQGNTQNRIFMSGTVSIPDRIKVSRNQTRPPGLAVLDSAVDEPRPRHERIGFVWFLAHGSKSIAFSCTLKHSKQILVGYVISASLSKLGPSQPTPHTLWPEPRPEPSTRIWGWSCLRLDLRLPVFKCFKIFKSFKCI